MTLNARQSQAAALAFGDVSIAGVRAMAVAAGHPGLVVADAADAEAAWSGLAVWVRGLSATERRRLRRQTEATLFTLANFVRTLGEHGLSSATLWALLPLLLAWQLLCDALDDSSEK